MRLLVAALVLVGGAGSARAETCQLQVAFGKAGAATVAIRGTITDTLFKGEMANARVDGKVDVDSWSLMITYEDAAHAKQQKKLTGTGSITKHKVAVTGNARLFVRGSATKDEPFKLTGVCK